jgi:hypothetical protein
MMSSWCSSITGKNKLANMSLSELSSLIRNIKKLQKFAAGFTSELAVA